MTTPYAIEFLNQSLDRLNWACLLERSGGPSVREQYAKRNGGFAILARSAADTASAIAANAEVRRIRRSEVERRKLGVRTVRVGRLEVSRFRAFGMKNVTVRWNGSVVVKLGVR